jgi:hypothetical protein
MFMAIPGKSCKLRLIDEGAKRHKPGHERWDGAPLEPCAGHNGVLRK